MTFPWNQINPGMADGVCVCREGGAERRAWVKKRTCPKYSLNYNEVQGKGKNTLPKAWAEH